MIIGYLKGKSAIRIHRNYGRTRGSFFEHSFWSRGHCGSTEGFDEESIRRYVEEQGECDDEDQGTLKLD